MTGKNVAIEVPLLAILSTFFHWIKNANSCSSTACSKLQMAAVQWLKWYKLGQNHANTDLTIFLIQS